MTQGQIFRANVNDQPAWSTATYPDTAGTTGNVLISNGTNWVSASRAAFYAYMSAATQATNGATTVQADTEVFDIGSNYNNGTYTFTAPSTGIYFFGASAYFASVDFILLQFVATSITVSFNYNATASQQTAQNHTALISMSAGDTCVFKAGSNTPKNIQNTAFLGGTFATYFYGYQVS